MPGSPMDPSRLYGALIFDEARELAEKMLDPETDPDEVADLIEHAVDKSDRAHAVIFYLLVRAKGRELPPAVELANVEPGPESLIIARS